MYRKLGSGGNRPVRTASVDSFYDMPIPERWTSLPGRRSQGRSTRRYAGPAQGRTLRSIASTIDFGLELGPGVEAIDEPPSGVKARRAGSPG
jgi:hypothetical protein